MIKPSDKLHVEERMAGLFYLAGGCLR